MLEINTERIPIKMWLNDIEPGALTQATHLANLPFAFSHVAIMPDAHEGYGMPIGTVLATNDIVIPNAVGVDIGCGMHLIKTDLTEIDKEGLVKILTDIRKDIPLGFSHRDKPREDKMPKYTEELPKIVQDQYNSALNQVGTLGGGNHFIEVQKSNDGFICAMIHSGSRNIGFKAANYYNKVAKDLNSKWHTNVPKDWDLASLPIDTEEGQAYIREMKYCTLFAKANREFMMEFIKDSFLKNFGAKITEEHDVPHNYAALEKHFGKQVWVHRKGATSALEGQLGLIPGSQGTSSYVVEGLGNMWSFKSCSHGAGRRLGRNVAKRTLNLEEEKKKLDDQGIIHSIRGTGDLDEASGAYKDIDVVMENQKELVKIVTKLSPLAVVKG
jgi:tRNA-splicing ligase RtcB